MRQWADIDEAAQAIQAGQAVGMPTETVYGLAADARSDAAVARVFAIKQRPSFDPLIVHVEGLEQAEQYALFDDQARRVVEAFWPGPLTVILPRRSGIADLVTSGLETVGIRAPDHPVAQALIRRSGCPLAAPSANRFGALSPTTPQAVVEQLGDQVPLILDGGPCRVGVESTVLRLGPEPLILRPGGISAEHIGHVIGALVAVSMAPAVDAGLAKEAPGQLASHYAPSVPLTLSDGTWPTDPSVARLRWCADDGPAGPSVVLSSSQNSVEAAARLFAALRELQSAPGVTRIVAELVPEDGIGRAINDRLRRAAGLG